MTTWLAVFLGNVLCALVCGALAIPLIRGRVKMNRVYGVRFQRAFESDALWYQINAYGGRRLLAWSVVIALIGVAALFIRDESVLIALAFAPTLYLVAAFDAWWYARRL